MWAQYGADNSGVCLVFSKKELLRQVNRIEHRYLFMDNIDYCKRISVLRYGIEHVEIGKPDYEMDAVTHLNNHKKSIFFSKHIDFEQENEFRVGVIEHPENDGFLYVEIFS